MNIILFGAGGFIGKNLAVKLIKDLKNNITAVDKSKYFFEDMDESVLEKIEIKEDAFAETSDFDNLLQGQDIVYHLISSTVPGTSNQSVAEELKANVIATVYLLEACVRRKIKRVVFFSSGGTVYGKNIHCPIKEESQTYPICSYGLQKISIEKLLYMYQYMYGLDYRIIRLSNPYGPYQRPNGILGAVTTFTYRALKKEKIIVYGDGLVVRDFIYISDAIEAVVKVAEGENEYSLFNIGCGYGTSIKQLLETIHLVLDVELKVGYEPSRKVDVPINYLDISRYERYYGKLNLISLSEGIYKTSLFLKKQYNL